MTQQATIKEVAWRKAKEHGLTPGTRVSILETGKGGVWVMTPDEDRVWLRVGEYEEVNT